MDEWSNESGVDARSQQQQQQQQQPQQRSVKRVMTPAIESMSVKDERACLSEIRKLGPEVDHQHILSNGWTTGKFALLYVTGQHDKRKTKTNGKGTVRKTA